MEFRDGVFTEYDKEAAKILDGFLPDEMFDAHAHIYDKSFIPQMYQPGGCFSIHEKVTPAEYMQDMSQVIGNRKVHLNMIATPDEKMADATSPLRKQCTAFLKDTLEKFPGHVGEVMCGPDDTVEDLEKQLVHPGVIGFKCYHVCAKNKPTWQAAIGEYLPEAAWEAANKHHLCITLHMVRDKALADPVNYEYIISMAKKYPDAVLILAHAARSFAAWTGLETVDKIKDLDNVWYDFGAVCESPAMFQIIRKAGLSKCMWGSDFPVALLAGKAISLADSFYWINAKDLNSFAGPTTFHGWTIATENLMAHRQVCLMLDLKEREIEDLFCNNAKRLFGVK